MAQRTDDLQHSCGRNMVLLREPGTFRIHGVDIPVEHLFYRCEDCDEEIVTQELAEEVENLAASRFREEEGYLSGSEIRALRERFELTQEQFEGALGLGAKSLARWENERVLQTRSTDDLLRLIRRDPSALLHLAELHGVDIPRPPGATAAKILDIAHWPRDLVALLESSCEAQGTDLNSYLLWFLSCHTSVTRTIESAGALMRSTLNDHLKVAHEFVVSQADEPWQIQHKGIMGEASEERHQAEYAI